LRACGVDIRIRTFDNTSSVTEEQSVTAIKQDNPTTVIFVPDGRFYSGPDSDPLDAFDRAQFRPEIFVTDPTYLTDGPPSDEDGVPRAQMTHVFGLSTDERDDGTSYAQSFLTQHGDTSANFDVNVYENLLVLA